MILVATGCKRTCRGEDGKPDLRTCTRVGRYRCFGFVGRWFCDRPVGDAAFTPLPSIRTRWRDPSSWEVPSWSVTVAGASCRRTLRSRERRSVGAGVHAKGLAEAMGRAPLVVSVVKPVFGRHRPDWSASSADSTKDDSFPSGHATKAFAIATYSASICTTTCPGDHTLAYAGLFTGACCSPASGGLSEPHFASDVAAGALLGANDLDTSSTLSGRARVGPSNARLGDSSVTRRAAVHFSITGTSDLLGFRQRCRGRGGTPSEVLTRS